MEIDEDSENDINQIKENNSEHEFMSIKKWRYLSYLLLFLALPSALVMNDTLWDDKEVSVGFVFLPLMTVLSFSKYVYLRYNDNHYSGITFFHQSSYLNVIIQLCLYYLFFRYLFLGIIGLALFFEVGGWGNFVMSLYPILFLLVIISLSFEKKTLEEIESDLKETESNSERGFVDDGPTKKESLTLVVQKILGLSAFVTFLVGFFFVQLDIYGWGGRSGTFALASSCYSITFVLLVLMLAARLGAQGASEPSQKEKNKADNWKTFKTRMIVLVVVFSLLMPLLWYESETYWKDRESPILDNSEDCKDEIVGPDIDLTNTDFTGMKLRGCDLSNRDLTGALFSGTNLACVDFSNSILKGALFASYPDIRGTTFNDTDLSDSAFIGNSRYSNNWGDYEDVSGVYCDYDLSFKGANLTNANFNMSFSSNSRGYGEIVFDNAIMDNTNFVVLLNYEQISFDNVILNNSNFEIDMSDYSTFSMINASFIGTNISMDLPPGSNLSQSNMSEANFIDFLAPDLSSCPLSLPETYNCAEIGGKKMIFGSGMDFSNKYISFDDPDSLGTDSPGVNFSGLNLPNSTFHGVHLSDSNISNANFSNSNFSYSHKIYNQEYSNYNYYMEQDEENKSYVESQLEEWGVEEFSDLKSLWAANLTNVDFTGTNLSYSDFSYSNMLGANLTNADLTGVKWYYTICPDSSNSGETGSCNTN